MPIELQPYEMRALQTLAQRFQLEEELILGFAEDLNSLANFFAQAISYPATEFHAGRVVVMGFINHAHCLLAGGLQAIEAGNAAVWGSCVRGLIETFGACVLISERPLSAPNYLEHVKAGKLYAAATRVHPGFAHDLKRLHQLVHPASGAILAASTPLDEQAKTALFRFGLHRLDPLDGREGVTVLANLAVMVVERFKDIITKPDVLAAGAVILDRKRES
jgi:hypothetical protein